MKKTTMTMLAALALPLAACGTTSDQPEATVTSETAAPTSSSTSSSTTTTPEPEPEPEPASESSTTTTPEPEPEPASESSTTTTPEPEPEPTSSSTPEPSFSNDVGAFGDTYTWNDGVEVTISTPTAYTPDQYAAGGEGYEHHVSMTVTITNGSGAILDASFVSPSVTSGQREGDEVFDEAHGGSPMSSILPGRTVTFEAAYGIDDPSDVVAEFAPTWNHSYAYWTTDAEGVA